MRLLSILMTDSGLVNTLRSISALSSRIFLYFEISSWGYMQEPQPKIGAMAAFPDLSRIKESLSDVL